MTQVSYQGGQYTETVDIKGVITLTPIISAFEQALIDMQPKQSIYFKYNEYSTNQGMIIKHGNGKFTEMWKSPGGKWRINASSYRTHDNLTLDELRTIIFFDQVVSFFV